MSLIKNRKPAVDFVVTHQAPHLDEIVAIVLFGWNGASKYFLRNPKLETMKGDADLRNRVDARSNAVQFGMGQGARSYNEYDPDGVRAENTCCTKLVAEDLGVADKPELQKLLAEVLRADTEGGQPHFSVANILKTVHKHAEDAAHPMHAVRTLGFAKEWIYAMVSRERGDSPKGAPPKLAIEPLEKHIKPSANAKQRPVLRHIAIPVFAPLSELMKLWMVLEYGQRAFYGRQRPEIHAVTCEKDLGWLGGKDDVLFIGIAGGQFGPEVTVDEVAKALKVGKMRHLKQLLGIFRRFEQEPEKMEYLEFPNVIDALNTHGEMKPGDIWAEVKNVFDAYHLAGQAFNQGMDEELERFRFENIGGIKVAFGNSDSPDAWARTRTTMGAKVHVQMNSRGNVIFMLADDVQDALLRPLAREVVKAELALHQGINNGGVEPVLEQLENTMENGGNLPGTPHWFYFKSGGHLLNGSTTHEEVPTKLTVTQIYQLVCRAVSEAFPAPSV
ncbi:MAG: hypothetical protein ABIA47_00625 [bacterium]